MRNIKLVIAYDGTGYGGWQRQKNAPTIQGEIEKRLAIMTAGKVSLLGAGRTDAGVHALGMVANFHTAKTLSCEAFLKGLNSLLPPGIRILSVEDAATDFHSRFSAQAKTYVYNLFTGPVLLPTERLYVFHIPFALDPSMIEDCLRRVRGTHDFACFEMQGSRDKSCENGRGSIRTILSAEFKDIGDHHCQFSITGDGFLRQMVRIMVGTILEVGKGRMSSDEFQKVLDSRDRAQACPPAPAHGLALLKIFYSGA
jgi:tRNA pseudouridine38-40 synthase